MIWGIIFPTQVDFVAFAIDFSVKFGGHFAVGLGRDHVDSALLPDQVCDPTCVICFVHCPTGYLRRKCPERGRARVDQVAGCSAASCTAAHHGLDRVSIHIGSAARPDW